MQTLRSPLDLTAYLADCEARFSPEMGLIGMTLNSPGYTTAIPSGQWIHPTVNNFEYASLLLRAGGKADVARAQLVLERLLHFQDCDPVSRKFGIWPWFVEEPLEKLPHPDWNWADFCGGRIGEILLESEHLLGDPLRQNLERALENAALSIFRRNVTPDYTNIAIMGAGVCAMAGERFDASWLLRYARRRLAASVESFRHHGGFNEYNSPPYTSVVIQECERIHHVVRDPEVREATEFLRKAAWQTIAEHFHPRTGQWAGPHARSYNDRLDSLTVGFLTERTGMPIACAPSSNGAAALWTGPLNLTVHPLPCPIEFLSCFRDPVSQPEERRHTFIRNGAERTVSSVTWLAPDACLGSVNRGEFWTQRRSVLGYWQGEGGAVITFRLRFLKDGRDFASALVRCAQKETRILAAVTFARDLGDWHLMLDRPASGEYFARDLRLRCEIYGAGAFVQKISDRDFILGAGSWQVALRGTEDQWQGEAIHWEAGGNEDCKWVDAVILDGKDLAFRPGDEHDFRLGLALELRPTGSPGSFILPGWKDDGSDRQVLEWDALSVSLPRETENFFA
jgi:hypothetical protein